MIHLDRVKLDIINNIKGIQENVAEIKDTLLPKKKQIISDRMIALITMIIEIGRASCRERV